MVSQEAIIGTFKKHSEAVDAVLNIEEMGIDVSKHIQIIGKGELIEDHLHIQTATNALRVSILFGAIVGAIAGLGVASTAANISHLEAFLAAMCIGALAGIVLGTVKAYIIGPKGQLHLHKHWQLNEYQVVTHDIEPETVEKIQARLKVMGN